MLQSNAIYEVFDGFLKRSTRDSISPAHSLDETEFYRALVKVVEAPGFRVEELRDHILEKHEGSDAAAEYYVHRATIIREYLRAIGQI